MRCFEATVSSQRSSTLGVRETSTRTSDSSIEFDVLYENQAAPHAGQWTGIVDGVLLVLRDDDAELHACLDAWQVDPAVPQSGSDEQTVGEPVLEKRLEIARREFLSRG